MYNQTREMAEELNRMIKKRVGAEVYLPLFQEITQKAAKKREERKRKSNMTLILDPQVSKRVKKIKEKESRKGGQLKTYLFLSL